MNKKTIFAILLAGVMTASMFMGCGADADDAQDDNNGGTVSTPAVSDDADDNADDDADNTDDTAQGVEMTEEVYDKIINDIITDIYGDNANDVLGSMGSMDIDMLSDRTGVDKDMIISHIAMAPMMNTSVDELIILEVADENLETVKEALEAYKTSVIAGRDPEQGGFPYLPDHLPKAQNAQVEIIGNVVVYFAVADTSAIEDEASFADAITADVEKAIAATKANLGVE